MSEQVKAGALKRFFTRGLAALLPTVLTIILLVWAFEYLNNIVGIPLGRGVLWCVDKVGGKPVNDLCIALFGEGKDVLALRKAKLAPTLVGFPIAIVIIFVAGFFITSFVGRKIFVVVESRFLARFPIVKVVYPYAKQFTEFFFGEGTKVAFRGTVMIQYPRPGVYSLGFVTSDGLKTIDERTGRHHVTVFVPTSPTPATGFVVLVPADEVIPLAITVEEAARFVLTGGVVVPERQMVKGS